VITGVSVGVPEGVRLASTVPVGVTEIEIVAVGDTGVGVI